MNNIRLIFAVFSFLVGILLLGIWSNTHVYAQQLSSPSSASTSSFRTTTISSELKAKMCDPSNPSLKVVNTTEARICGIPKTVKPPTLSAATSPTTSAVSSSKQQQTIKATPTSVANIAAPKQNQITATNDNNALSRSSGAAATKATIAPVGNLSNKSLSSQSIIAPQINTIDKQQQGQQPQLLTTISNGTGLQNYTFSSISPVVPPGELMYLGYHGGDGTPTNDDSGSKRTSISDNKPSTDRSSSSSTHSSFTEKKISTSKSDRTSTTDGDGSSSPKLKVDTKPSTHRTSSSSANSSSKDKDSSDGKPSTDHNKGSTTTDNDSTEKKKTSTSKSDRTHSINDDSRPKHKSSSDTKSSSHNDDGGKSSSSDLGSAIRKKVDSIIKKSLSDF